MKKIRNYLWFVYTSPRYLLIYVLFLLAILFLSVESQHEDILYHNIIRANRLKSKGQNDTLYIRNLMNTINTMMYNRQAVFQNTEKLSVKNRLFNSVDADLMYGHGACGGFSKVLARSLKLSGYRVRIGQMKVDGLYGGHIIVEVFLGEANRWVVIDPLFLLTFKSRQDGNWAGFEEVGANWKYYQGFVPAGYDGRYRYENIRYTNWEKIPVVGLMGYKLLSGMIGKERADSISIRVWILNKYYTYLCVFGIGYILFIMLSVRRFRRKHRPVLQAYSRSLAA
jgi:hypothetical protein